MVIRENNSYLSIARRAHKVVLRMYGCGGENEFAASAQKTAERYLKAVLEEYPADYMPNDVLKSHSLRKLYGYTEHLGFLGINQEVIGMLNGYYFEASYPGDNFIMVSKEQEKKCKEMLEEIATKVELFFDSKETGLTHEFNH